MGLHWKSKQALRTQVGKACLAHQASNISQIIESIGEEIIVGIENVKIGYAERNVLGDQAITGLGFKPKVVIFFSFAVTTDHLANWGFDDGVTPYALITYEPAVGTSISGAFSVCGYVNSSNFIYGHISSMDADGFTINWDTLVGAANACFVYLAMK